ncbi:hypothetical protein WJX81_000138 [Elliptochloris bilobata]|uniref:Uncharacterized protein n=1 Tax=Elliptochloris bilobata TaxID=381761 RepID=A0AAW1SJH4_9CHLO
MLLSTAPFVGARPVQASRAAVPRRVLRCRVQAAQQADSAAGLKLAALSMAAAALLHAAPAFAGVQFDKKATTKKVFQNDASAAAKVVPAAKAAAGGAGISLPSLPSFKAPELGVNLGTIAIPAAVVAIGGGFVALSKLDTGFGNFITSTVVKDSGEYAGYEQALQRGFTKASKAPKKAAKSVAKAADKAAKKQGFSLPNPFAK